MLGHFSAGLTLHAYTYVTNDMQWGTAEKISGFMNSPRSLPDPLERKQDKVAPFEMVG